MAKAKRKAPDKDTLRELFLKSGNICAFPGCMHLMMNRDRELIGQICHIEAAEEGGERFNPAKTDDERAAFANLMLMCYQHHVETNDVDEFPVLRLQTMKAEHEAKFTDPSRAMEEGYAKQISGDVCAKQQASHGGINVAGHGNTVIQGLIGVASDPYADLDDIMGEFLSELRDGLHQHPDVRDILVMEGSGVPNARQPAFLFRDEKYPDISSWVDTLEQRGLVRDQTKGGLRRVRMTHAFVKFLNSTGKTRLSDYAARLLAHAAAGDGMVMLILSSEGLGVQAGSFSRQVPHDQAREQSTWRAAGEELLNLGLIQHHGYNGEMFDMTKEGWDAVSNWKSDEVEAIKQLADG
jgi:hypothetical protein